MASNVLPFPIQPSNDNSRDDPPQPPLVLSLKLRGQIEATIEYLVSLLDQADGDTDLEEETDQCEAGDDGCGFFSLGGRSAWGSTEEEGGWQVPHYGIDQSKGPLAPFDNIVKEAA